MSEIRRKNHFVPRLYLKHWTDPDGRVQVYRTLVAQESIPLWKSFSPGGVGYREHLYTRLANGEETDALERWLDREFETPVNIALERATTGQRMSSSDWHKLIRFTAAQIVRTPAAMLRRLREWERTMPDVLQETLSENVRRLESSSCPVEPVSSSDELSLNRDLPLSVRYIAASPNEPGALRAEFTSGRKAWHWSIRRALTVPIDALLRQKWTILRPPVGRAWITSDDPVITLNFYSDGEFDFGGGWDRKGSEVIFPLDPQHLLYTKIGSRPPKRGERVDDEFWRLILLLTARHAHRAIYGPAEVDEVARIRPRVVDAGALAAEKGEWESFDERHREVERA